MTQKLTKGHVFLLLVLGGGKINRPRQLASRGEDNQGGGGGKISRDIFTSSTRGGGGGKLSREQDKLLHLLERNSTTRNAPYIHPSHDSILKLWRTFPNAPPPPGCASISLTWLY